MASLNCPVCDEPFQPGDLLCLSCGANLARAGGGGAPPRTAPPPPPQQGQPYQQQPPYGEQPQYGAPPQQQAPPPQQDPWGAPPQQAPQQQDPWSAPPPQQQAPPQQAPAQQDPWSAPPPNQQAPQQQAPQPADGWGAPPPNQQAPYDQGRPGYDPYAQQQHAPQHGQPQHGQPQHGQHAPQQDQYGAPPQQDQYGQQYGGQPNGYQQQGYPPQQGQQPPQQYGGQGLGQGYAPGPQHGGPQHGGPQHGSPQHGRGPAPDSTAAMCPYCEAVLSSPAAAQCDSCLRPLNGPQGGGGAPQAGPPAAPTLRVQFPSGDVKIGAGQHLVLGRDAGQSPVAGTFTQYDNVSRRHSTVWLDPSGTAWVRDEGSTNGTFVNGERLPRGVEAPLRDGDQLRLAADVTGTVQLS